MNELIEIELEIVQKRIEELNDLLKQHNKNYTYGLIKVPNTYLPYSIMAITTNGYIIHDHGFTTIRELYEYVCGYIQGLEV